MKSLNKTPLEFHRLSRLTFLLGCLASIALPYDALADTKTPDRPNILFITVDDMNWDTPGCFGGTVEDITPNIDRLACEGMRFEHGHVTVAVCQPSRQTLMTGRYPHRFGALGFSPIDTSITTLAEVLSEASYINGILGKVTHLQPAEKYKWSYHQDRRQMGFGRNPDLFYEKTKYFIEEAARKNKPFFLMANSHDPHRPFHSSVFEKRDFSEEDLRKIKPPSRVYKEDEVNIPGFLPDLRFVRKEVAQYYSSAKRADDTVGAVLRALRDTGQEENTLVMFMSDNGMPFPSAKWNTYLQSTRTPWIVRWPGKVKPNTVDTKHFISGIDFMSTILDAVGLQGPEGMDGKSFLPLLTGGKQSGRDHVITAHYQAINYYNYAGGTKETRKKALDSMVATKGWRYKDEWGGLIKDYPIRCIQNERYGYMYNEWSDGKNFYFCPGVTGRAMKRAAKTDPEIKKRVDMIRYRVPEEFYDFHNDPYALNNLIDDRKHQHIINQMREKLLRWMEDTGDPALPAFKKQIQN